MKTLLFTVGGSNDYDAQNFTEYSIISGEHLAYQRYLDMFSEDMIDEFEHLVIDDIDNSEMYIPCKLQVIKGTIPKEFVDYIRNEIQEHDSTKDKQFYLIEVK